MKKSGDRNVKQMKPVDTEREKSLFSSVTSRWLTYLSGEESPAEQEANYWKKTWKEFLREPVWLIGEPPGPWQFYFRKPNNWVNTFYRSCDCELGLWYLQQET